MNFFFLEKDRKHGTYQRLVAEFKSAHKHLTHNQCDAEVAKIWSAIKKTNWADLAQLEIRKWKHKSEEIRLTRSKVWSNFLARKVQKQPFITPILAGSSIEKTQDESASSMAQTCSETPIETEAEKTNEDEFSKSEESARGVAASILTPRQNELKLQMTNINTEIVFLINKKSNGIASDADIDRLKKLQLQLSEHEKKLKIKISGQARQQRKRQHDRNVLAEIRMNHPDVAEKFGSKQRKVGRPRLEKNHPELLTAIVDIATYGCGADEKRRSNMLRSIHTLDELTAELNSQGFQVCIFSFLSVFQRSF